MALYVSGGPPHPAGLGWSARRAARRRDRDNHLLGLELRDTWRWTAEGTAVARVSPCVAGGVVVSVPEVVAVDLGPPVRLTVRLLAGQLVEDLAAAAPRLAEGLGVAALRVERASYYGYAVVTLLADDPLAATADASGGAVSSGISTLLGHDEAGRPVELDPFAGGHVILQGSTGAGKSTFTYGLLGELGQRPDVEISGADPSGLLLGPWAARGGLIPPSLGTRAPADHVRVVEALVAEMDARTGRLPLGQDAVTIGPDCPLILATFEEYLAILRVVDTDKQLGKLFRAAVGRLLGEGRKAGVCVVLSVLRAEASLVGSYERGQCATRISFRVDTAEAVKLLHPDVPVDVVAAHTVAPAGVGLLTAPGRPLTRFRAPHVAYADYCATVAEGRPA